MALREYVCAECGGTFTHELRGRPRVSCETCAPLRERRQIAEWEKARTTEQRQSKYEKQRDAAIVRAAAWNKANPERRSSILRKHNAKPEVRAAKAAYRVLWQKANPEKMRAYGEKYKRLARKLFQLDDESYAHAMHLYGDPCSYCGSATQEIDHVVPIASGGANHWTNLTAACRPCNRRKHSKPLLRFMLDTREW